MAGNCAFFFIAMFSNLANPSMAAWMNEALYTAELNAVTIIFDEYLLHGLAQASDSESGSLGYSSVSLMLANDVIVKLAFPVQQPRSPSPAPDSDAGRMRNRSLSMTTMPGSSACNNFPRSRSPRRQPTGRLCVDPGTAQQEVASRLQVPVAHLIVPTPPDGMGLFYCFAAWELGDQWLLDRGRDGFCSDAELRDIDLRMAINLQRRLAHFMDSVNLMGRSLQEHRLQFPTHGKVFPGNPYMPFLAQMMNINIVVHDLVHPAQPSLVYWVGARDTMHIGATFSHGWPHWVLLRVGRFRKLSVPSASSEMPSDSEEDGDASSWGTSSDSENSTESEESGYDVKGEEEDEEEEVEEEEEEEEEQEEKEEEREGRGDEDGNGEGEGRGGGGAGEGCGGKPINATSGKESQDYDGDEEDNGNNWQLTDYSCRQHIAANRFH